MISLGGTFINALRISLYHSEGRPKLEVQILTEHHRENFSRSEPSFDGLGGFEPPDFDFADHRVIHLDLLGGSLVKRHTRLELVTSTMARWRTTNCANAAWCGVVSSVYSGLTGSSSSTYAHERSSPRASFWNR